MINIDIKELLELLDVTPSEQNIMLSGKHGIGKSEILTDYFSKKGMKVVTLFLGQMSDPGDLIGLPTKDEKTGHTTFMPPYWFPVNNEPVVLFLDELNRARPEVLQTIMDLALNKKLAGRTLPQGSRIISAVNDGGEYQLTDLDPALVSRFNIYQFRPSVQEWLIWAQKNAIDARIIAFIEKNPTLLDGDGKDTMDRGLEKSPDRRAWKKVSDCIQKVDDLESIHKKMIGGIIGTTATQQLIQSINTQKMLTGKDILLNWEKKITAFQKCKLHEVSLINEQIYRFLEVKQYDDKQKEKVKDNLVRYVQFLIDEKKKEEMAHFVSIFEQAHYPTAIGFILTETPSVYAQIADFITHL